MIKRRGQVYSNQSISPDSHKVTELYAAVHAPCALPPTPFKYLSFVPDDPQKRAPEEVLKPGALYTDCAVVTIRIPTTLIPPTEEKTDGGGDEKTPVVVQQRPMMGNWVA